MRPEEAEYVERDFEAAGLALQFHEEGEGFFKTAKCGAALPPPLLRPFFFSSPMPEGARPSTTSTATSSRGCATSSRISSATSSCRLHPALHFYGCRVYSDSSPLLAAQVLASLSELLDAQSVHSQPASCCASPESVIAPWARGRSSPSSTASSRSRLPPLSTSSSAHASSMARSSTSRVRGTLCCTRRSSLCRTTAASALRASPRRRIGCCC